MNRIDRLFGILVILQSRKYISAETLADKFNISLRTVYRDIKSLGEQGIPISFEPHKGYCIVQGYFLPPVSFTNEEANALLLMEYLVNGFADKSIQKHYNIALTKVKAVLKNQQKEKIDILQTHTKFQMPLAMQHDYEYLSIIQQCISNKTIIEIDYKNKKDEVSRRQLETIGLIFYAFNWHMIGWCHLRKQYRDFKVSRISGIKDTQIAFTRSDHMEIGDYMKELPVNW